MSQRERSDGEQKTTAYEASETMTLVPVLTWKTAILNGVNRSEK